MFKFEWKGIDNNGKVIKGETVGATGDDVTFELTKKGIEVISIKKLKVSHSLNRREILKKGLLTLKKEETKGKPKEIVKPGTSNKSIPKKELLLFTKQFYSMTKAGIPIIDVMELLKDQLENPVLKIIANKVYDDIQEGLTISESFAKHKQFDKIYISMIKAGEMSGKLDFFLNKLYLTIEKEVELTKTIKKALFYPAMLFSVALIVIVILFIYVVPVFAKMYGGMGRALPAPTQAVIDISDFLSDPMKGGLLAVILIGGAVFHKFMKKTSLSYKIKYDKFLFKVPLFGELIIRSSVAKMSLLIGNLMGAGVNLNNILDITLSTMDNEVIKRSIKEVNNGIMNGGRMSVLFRKEQIFPKQFEAMIEIGEESGSMEEMLQSVSEYYEGEVKDSVEKLTGLLEPMLLVFLGLTVGFILVAMYMPIFNMGQTV